jgi:aromatic ring-opening dioxygenase catalytic subunit (LigB family)
MPANSTLPTYFISHGGGPWPYMKNEMPGVWDKLEASLKAMPRELGVTPKAVLAISGHWEEPDFTVMSSPQPPMIYDYSGFPEHTYRVKYSAPGAPDIAQRVQTLLSEVGFKIGLDDRRGYDHGVFAPFFVIYPDAHVPILQLSIRADYDPAAHLAAGRALVPLRSEGVLIVGSGLSYHNMRGFGPRGAIASREFDNWLNSTVCESRGTERSNKLMHWEAAPAARSAHPQEDHLIPLMVAVGAAEQDQGECTYHEDAFMGGVTVSSFRFGGVAAVL